MPTPQVTAALSGQQLKFWHENGFILIPGVVPPENLTAVIDAIWEFQGLSPRDPDSWYRPQPEIGMRELNRSGMVEMFHHQSLWDNRQHPAIHSAFSALLGTHKLWVTIDRANMNLPIRPDWEFPGFIHWDIDTSLRPLPFQLQGLIALQDTPPRGGGFQCVPGFPRRFERWVQSQPQDRDPWRPDLADLEVREVETKAGDLLIWTSLLPHGTSPNRSDQPRFAQYISMFPAPRDDENLRRQRIRMWKTRAPLEGMAFPGDARFYEQQHGKTAVLTDLGKKLLGLERW